MSIVAHQYAEKQGVNMSNAIRSASGSSPLSEMVKISTLAPSGDGSDSVSSYFRPNTAAPGTIAKLLKRSVPPYQDEVRAQVARARVVSRQCSAHINYKGGANPEIREFSQYVARGVVSRDQRQRIYQQYPSAAEYRHDPIVRDLVVPERKPERQRLTVHVQDAGQRLVRAAVER